MDKEDIRHVTGIVQIRQLTTPPHAAHEVSPTPDVIDRIRLGIKFDESIVVHVGAGRVERFIAFIEPGSDAEKQVKLGDRVACEIDMGCSRIYTNWARNIRPAPSARADVKPVARSGQDRRFKQG